MAQAAMSRLGLPANRCIMVGDRLETDILMGLQAGMATALVLTGATTMANLPHPTIKPTYVLANVGELLDKETV
jgi:ribonucleotide monophosphatase NagD (HAD superfamily)